MCKKHEIVIGDIGGTNARFCLARLDASGVITLGQQVNIKVHDYLTFADAFRAYRTQIGPKLPKQAAIAIASPIKGTTIKLTNNAWIIDQAALKQELALEAITFVNDFGAVGHSLAQLAPQDYSHLAGPEQPLPDNGVITVLGPGTGLGVAHVLRTDGRAYVMESEGGHISFAPTDAFEDALLARTRRKFGRVSAERLIAGPGILEIYALLAAQAGQSEIFQNDTELWQAGLSKTDPLAAAAIHRFCLLFGSVAGDLALAHGAQAVVVAGGIVPRLVEHLAMDGFSERFTAKGRFTTLLNAIPVKLIVHPDPGLLGAAIVGSATIG